MSDPSDTPRSGRVTIILCFMVALLEGFDIQSAGVAAPKLAPALGLAPNSLGLVFSASTVGMFIGAYLGGRAADRFGRKPVLLVAVAAFGIFSILTGLTHSLELLVAARLFTGLGLGGALPALIALAAENNPARRSRAVALMYAGTPLGGAVSGAASMMLSSWEAIFYVGGLLPLLVLPALALFLKETHRPAPAGAAKAVRAGVVRSLFGAGRAPGTLLLWLAFFCGMLVLYLMLNWTPILLAYRGFPKPQVALFQATLNVVGAISVMVAASMLDGKGRIKLAAGAYGLTAIASGLVAVMPPELGFVIFIACLFGAGLLTSQSILYASAPILYPEEVRGTGVGSAVAAGRVGSVTGPILAAGILSAGVTPAMLIALTIPIVIMGGIANIALLAFGRARTT